MAETLSERVAELERERDAHKARADHNYREFVRLEAELNAAESREKQARVEGAREALTRCAAHYEVQGRIGTAERVVDFRDREYPATGEEPTRYVPEPPRVVRLSGGRVMRWEHNEFGVAWLCRNGSELPPMHFFRNSRGERMYDYRVIAETPEDFTTLERLVQEVCAYLASRPTASGEG